VNYHRAVASRFESGTFVALLPGIDRDALLATGRPRHFGSGEHLMHQEAPGDPVLLLQSGHVKATFIEPQGKEIVLGFHGPGDILGELSFVHAEPRSSNVVALEPGEAKAISAADFRAFLGSRPAAALALFDAIGRRFRDANRTQVQFGASDTLGRIAARLVELCERHGHTTSSGIEIRLPLTQADLGAWTGASRASVAAALSTMRKLNWIETERKLVRVLDLKSLGLRAGLASDEHL